MTAAHTAAALNYLGADVETALLELSAIAPTLHAKVREHLFFDLRLPKILCLQGKEIYVDRSIDYPQVRFHNAIAELLPYVDNATIVEYLHSKFPSYDLGELYVSVS